MKDVTIDLPDELSLPVILKRENPKDVFISNNYKSINDLPEGGIIGTSSLRRQSQVSVLRPDITLKNLRGNIGTRLHKLDEGDYDAIILAAAGVIRLGLSERITQVIPETDILPAIGQGAIGIECRTDDEEVNELINALNDESTSLCIESERSFSRQLSGGCQLPIAGHAVHIDNEIKLTGMVAKVDGSEIIKQKIIGSIADHEKIGITLAEKLLSNGADKILSELLS